MAHGVFFISRLGELMQYEESVKGVAKYISNKVVSTLEHVL